ncbi:uncharacterized protein FOMMEDRAFT_166886 [Fomitiporia mediterranea MF3/22]|uniref:uncharacterized protein n=1 Tax=Fomitiporia mediterranea (strain MF3/22) TaxID=694068 RepID=UPI0004407C3E|nr:uncharacterized protein FOMMEDRAFT_166886 [Fomitiporia mediterranea MF3/22]EJD03487.1 hypothetical protein FOMMEDRAFT_166886 [Fomitiporia mediterranea MF3/22]
MHQTSPSTLPTISAFSRLPVELVSQILEFAYYDENLEPDVRLLSNCSLVCKQWSAPSQALLFRNVFLRSSSSFLSFRSAVDPSTTRGQTLGNSIVRLRLTIDHNYSDQLSHRALAFAVLSCPNLYELDLSVHGCGVSGLPSSGAAGAVGAQNFRAAPSFDAGILDLLRDGPPLRSLKFANWSDNDQLAFQLLSDVWPSLTAVSLKGTPPRLPASDNEPLLPFGCALGELRLGFQTMPRADFVSWIITDSTRSLRCLELESAPGTDFLRSLLLQCRQSLYSLAMPSCTSRDQITAIHGCENLKEFTLDNSTTVSKPLLNDLPASIEHIAFTLNRDTPLFLIVNFVKARRHLKAVTMHVWDDADAHPQLPSLRIVCAGNGVELIVSRGIQWFHETVRGDPVPFSSFPRLKEPANLQKMLCISRHARVEVARRPVQQRPRAESAPSLPMLPEFTDSGVRMAADGHREKL